MYKCSAHSFLKIKSYELIDGVHWVHAMMKTDDRSRKVLLWSIEGINTLADIINSKRAKEHRDLTTIPVNTFYQALIALQPHIELIPQHEDRISVLENNLASPIEYSKLLALFSKKKVPIIQSWLSVGESP